ncbi:hypothetical protein [Mesobacillus persicus]|uniref:hypothetical protein n=1 Tax=Mesobacillus persicus TaxID=930146 RepID=UPI000B827018|nr:hypothetical protein [Mesobacillus persicus]
MKRKYKAMMVIPATLLAMFALMNDQYYWLLYVAFILTSLNLLMMGIQAFQENKKSPFAYCGTVLAILVIFLSLKELLN